jgi:signal transduction histidine kinase
MDAGPVRRTGWQIASVTVGLITALLLALGIAAYLITDQALLKSLQDSLKMRANGSPHGFILRALQLHRPPPPPNSRRFDKRTQDVRLVIADNKLHVLVQDELFGNQLPDMTAARRALQSGKAGFSTLNVSGGQSYLVYTDPFIAKGVRLGVAQTTVSEAQYHDSQQAVLRGLLSVSVLGLLASAGISLVVVRRALRPIRVAMRHQRDFVADAAHELRTPLAIMRSAIELGLAAGTATEQQDALAQALAENSHLSRLVADLALLARADSGAVSLAREPVDLGLIAREAAVAVEMLAEDRGITLHVAAENPPWVSGDAGRLRQLLLIMLDNALKHTPEGGTIVVRVYRQGNQARLQVQDSGKGIAAADLPHVFDRFYRADRARHDGMGLGLAIGQWIAQAHGGQISAANAPEGGAVFTVSLPVAR